MLRVSSRLFSYKAPLRDMEFLLNEVLEAPSHYAKIGAKDATPETITQVLENCAKFCETTLSPLNKSGDKEGAKRLENGDVVTPKGFKEAYSAWASAGWQGLTVPEKYGGQGLPMSLGVLKAEMVGTANWSWGMYPGLSMGCMNTLLLHGSESQKEIYLSKLAEGTWTGTMCLTEPQCGTDLGQVATAATANPDGTYSITGTKIYISCGEHDFAENIVHIVLARLPNSPAGTKGISLFLVPKYLVNEKGEFLQDEKSRKKNVVCGRVEDKMGIKGSATCVMNFENSIGYLIGKPNDGLHQMFTFMNTARLGTGLQGIGAAEFAYQAAAPYAKERTSLRSLSGVKYPNKVSDPLIVHPDVRRMLLTMKAVAEGGRALLYDAALLGDYWMVEGVSEKEKHEIDDYLGFHTPIVKGFLTELGYECANHGVQVYGGHGFIKDFGVEQNVRDTRISTLYEGTTGIQALDLLGRKTLMKKGRHLKKFCSIIQSEAMKSLTDPVLGSFARELYKLTLRWLFQTAMIAVKSSKNKDLVNAVCVDYLYFSGYVSMGYYWLKMARIAQSKIAKSSGADKEFYTDKVNTAIFYHNKLLPRAYGHQACISTGLKGLMEIPDERF